MEESLKMLDRYDRQMNIYDLVVRCAEQGHKVLNSADPTVQENPASIVRVVLRSYMEQASE